MALTADGAGRARVRALARIASGDTQLLIVPRVRGCLDTELGIAEPERLKWFRHSFDPGLQAIEARLNDAGASSHAGPYAHLEQVPLADLCLSQPAFPRARPLVQQGAPAICCQTPARDLL